jgi:hypothetical protein
MRSIWIITAALTLVVGCATDEQTSVAEYGVESSNRIALNRIALNRIALNRIALNRIALNRIALNRLRIDSFTTAGLIDSDPELLDYVISCAFPAGVEVTGADSTGNEHTFHGGVGLAERWEIRRLTMREQRWMSACLLARVSNAGTPLFISLRGPHDALQVSAEEQNTFIHEEGAFYGDIFADEQKFYACQGVDLYNDNLGPLAALRACAKPLASGDTTVCGMTYAGECGAFNVERACAYQTGDYYQRCHAEPSKNGKWHDEGIATRFEEVITVWVPATPITSI